MDLSEVLAALEGLPEKERGEVVAQAMEATKDMLWLPNPGPQTMAYYSEADELFYGGQAGGGKSALINGLAVTSHQRTLILRRIREDAKKLAEAELLGNVLDGNRAGWNGSDLIWRNAKQLVQFGGCEQEEDKQRYKGDPHDLICVGRGTPVLLPDGQYCAVEELKVGQMVQTLEGPRRIQKKHPVQRKPSVEVVARNDLGVEVGRQIQSTTHALLSVGGWFSAADLGAACVPTQSHDVCTPSQSSSGRCGSSQNSPLSSKDCLRHKVGSCRRLLDRLFGWARRAFYPLSNRGSGSVACCDLYRGSRQPLLSSFRRALRRPWIRSAWPSGRQLSSGRAERDGLAWSLLASLMGHCSSGIRRCDERIQLCADSCSEQAAYPQCLLLQDDADQSSPSRWLADGRGETQKYSHSQDTYAHPYTKDIRQVRVSGSLRRAALEFTYVGERDVYDLQVEDVNHYITNGGFVNKNCFDEITDFLESQYEFITIWNRSAVAGQRCRVVATGNPPTSATGLWVIRRWAAWLDPRHPKPAKPGELRWYLRDEQGIEQEVDGRGPHLVDGKEVYAKSRTFIPAKLSDNPDLAADGEYERVLDGLPKELRDAYRDGKFAASLQDEANQTIPTAWVQAAMARWRSVPPIGIPMCAMGVDVAQGGSDSTAIAWRHDGWFAPIISVPGSDTPGGTDVAGLVIAKRRDGCKVIIDIGGGWGGDAYAHLRENGVDAVSYMGVKTSNRRTEDNLIKFFNVRTEAYWRLREALNPDQPGGSQIMLPDDQELLSDLTAPTYIIKGGSSGGTIHLEPKDKLVKRLGRSPDRGDAVVMAWHAGAKAITDARIWGQQHKGRAAPRVIMRKP